MVGECLKVIYQFGDQDCIGTARYPTVKRDEAGITPHGFQHHHPAVAGGSGLQPV